jgi:site-specific recombinase XerD
MKTYIEAFLSDHCAGKCNETPRAYRNKINYLYRSGCEELSQAAIDSFRAGLLERVERRARSRTDPDGLSAFTVRSVLVAVRTYLTWCHGRGLCGALECRPIAEPQAEPKAIEEGVIGKLLESARCRGAAWEQARNVALVHVLRDCGARVGAVVGMELGKLDLERGIAWSADKGNNEAVFFFSAGTVKAIRAWLVAREELKPVDTRLFTGRYGRGIGRNCVGQILDRLAKDAGCEGKRHNPHSWRHAFARDMLAAGADLSVVSPLMGHKSIVVTAKYYARWDVKRLQGWHRKFSPGRGL